MRPISRVLIAMALFAVSACTTAPPAARADPAADEKAVMQRAGTLLYRYGNHDEPGVMAMLDPQGFTVFGSNLTELVRTPDQLRGLMSSDLSQWKSATFSNFRNSDVRTSGTLATAFFVVTFSAESGPTMPIRLCTTWRKVNGEWMLTQSWNAVFEGG